ncbi:MAG: hypothetical protein A3G18_12950 [Rhodospirillales bacterium RIFCSPLOWO2_12_FULL_58_28]|nr:MAG: hypothetical protein A3H92_12805 [Rhodospirillales bacterium RIFCSPLOWO2_02_FULL_58_16]OHC78492.1 MAG: hypothetical protein A3G18_12950 [Rhodospirillales bacterium RIFCSPLOWO2_12_FULL_58_28]
MSAKTGVMICGHGSRDKQAVNEFNEFAGILRRRLSGREIESGFLQYSLPTIRHGLETLKARGAEHIICLPCMLFSAGHVKNDIPSAINAFTDAAPGVRVMTARELGVDAKLLTLAAKRIAEAEDASSSAGAARKDSLLLVVGRGSSDSGANSDISKITRMLWEGMGFGWAETAFSGVSAPGVGEALDRAAMSGYRQVVALPYFLFTGVRVKGVQAEVKQAASRWPNIKMLTAGHLGPHPLLVECFVERLEEMISGVADMNCRDCAARKRALLPAVVKNDSENSPPCFKGELERVVATTSPDPSLVRRGKND